MTPNTATITTTHTGQHFRATGIINAGITPYKCPQGAQGEALHIVVNPQGGCLVQATLAEPSEPSAIAEDWPLGTVTQSSIYILPTIPRQLFFNADAPCEVQITCIRWHGTGSQSLWGNDPVSGSANQPGGAADNPVYVNEVRDDVTEHNNTMSQSGAINAVGALRVVGVVTGTETVTISGVDYLPSETFAAGNGEDKLTAAITVSMPAGGEIRYSVLKEN